MAENANDFEATATGVMVSIKCGQGIVDDQEIKFHHDETAEPLTVSQEKERVLSEMDQLVQNSRWRIILPHDTSVEMEESALIKTYVHDLSRCTEIETYYV